MRYQYYFPKQGTVKCVSHYEGRKVEALAKCDPKDTYNDEVGQNLARARVDVKISDKRVKRAEKKYAEAREAAMAAHEYEMRMRDYYRAAQKEQKQNKKTLKDMLKKI